MADAPVQEPEPTDSVVIVSDPTKGESPSYKARNVEGFLQLEELTEGATADQLVSAIQAVCQESGIDIEEKLVSFTSDGPAVMTGVHNGVGVKLKAINPRMVHMVCMAHKVALVLSNIFKTEPRLAEYDKLLSSIYNYFGKSADRRKELENVSQQLGLKKLQVLRKHDIRWMSRAEVVGRIRQLYRVLLDFFKGETAANEIFHVLRAICSAQINFTTF
ncbi:hypothetical protein PLESTM_001765300 [Pleodorina starrii]|nr:hypothetical protein PLESTM_001765300 [Pleodorina starrii]